MVRELCFGTINDSDLVAGYTILGLIYDSK
jgi:hypothetical protein